MTDTEIKLNDSEPAPKKCTKCKQLQEVSCFSNDAKRKDGKHPWCKSCVKVANAAYRATESGREKFRTYHRNYARTPKRRAKIIAYQKSEKGREVKRATKIKAKFGLTREMYDTMLTSQNNCCATCKEPFRSTKHTHVDHDHATGRVRGILCNYCNIALANARDRIDVLRALIVYLDRSQ